jgi:hypothetical protein
MSLLWWGGVKNLPEGQALRLAQKPEQLIFFIFCQQKVTGN